MKLTFCLSELRSGIEFETKIKDYKTMNCKDWPTDLLETLLRLKLATFQYGVFQVVPLVAVDNSTLCNHNINNYKPNASRLTKRLEKAAYFIVRRTVYSATLGRMYYMFNTRLLLFLKIKRLH